ncbi:MAG: hypothetical protein K2N63_05530 [Lachnospiraceae bacterium]|nr:hypothetical protein [Lachnospiraceae bacterium]
MDTVLLQHPGNLYPENLVYCIGNVGYNYGFFAEIRDLLGYLSYADKFCLTPVVYWDKQGYYTERELICGVDNVFEYYFCPTSPIKYEEVFHCRNVVFPFPRQRLTITGGEWKYDYWGNEELRKKLGMIYKKYCKLNIVTCSYIETNLKEKRLRERTLGIHIRGTDFKRGLRNHPLAVDAKEFMACTKKVINKYDYKQIFLATDSLEALKLFQAEFGEHLIFYEDVRRSDGDVGVHLLESDRKNHHYKLGLEVLRDAYSLAACDALIAGKSNVSLGAWYIKLSKGEDYTKVMILDRGSGNASGREGKRYFASVADREEKKRK